MNMERRLDLVWLVLLAGTLLTWLLGETSTGGSTAVLLMLGIAGIKGGLVIREFMALRGVDLRWQGAVLGWLMLVLAVNLAAYWKGM